MTKKTLAMLAALIGAIFTLVAAAHAAQNAPTSSHPDAGESKSGVSAAARVPTNSQAAAIPAPVAVKVPRKALDCARPALLVQSRRGRELRTWRGPGPKSLRAANLPAKSIYMGSAQRFWVSQVRGSFGKVKAPWVWPQRDVWVKLSDPDVVKLRSMTRVVADLSQRSVKVYRGCRLIYETRAGIGAASSSSPKGLFWVSDLTPVPAAQYGSFGSFAFGLSTIQPNTPAGWTGGNQMAIHGTGSPASIGQAVSAGCLRISEPALKMLRRYLLIGTPVTIRA